MAAQLSDPNLHGTKCTPNLTAHAHKAPEEVIAWPRTVVRLPAASRLPPNTEAARPCGRPYRRTSMVRVEAHLEEGRATVRKRQPGPPHNRDGRPPLIAGSAWWLWLRLGEAASP
jgi:hypothetical protein